METSLLLSAGEEQILCLLQRGNSNQAISEATGISVNTVKYHLKKIYKKLHARNRIEAINNFNKTLKDKQS
ncbi:helix-turn-helix transcriptional regulator [Lentimicrobium sp.]|uniref:response regulator transcription factor n=1 Tax=Lentimicrobium sp. TaxID=2034841 RepID=UPI0025D71A2C|nr:helix-turn-helix transcriptional regulator [Lentimicrobium sp.]MCO5258050.1 helix-turn-helix transcriptional regulator [Lentimicrobium sp.]MCO5263371.1 helix-turn-helix transcriptional regulator [Lentimicrobium sp.]HPF65591.1 helix-turn-helix transcriptional regulator [Lentimicrobium sp.]HPR27382.1 helix-turn-helix transcriptional regulator [Lentimicrobium sp.]